MLKSLTKFFAKAGDISESSGNKRKDDYIIIVCQRNDIRRLEIDDIDPELCNMLGYKKDDLKNHSFNNILPSHTNELIGDYLEYGNEGNDLSSVLSKVRDFSLLTRERKIIHLSLRILPTTALDKNPRFCLILRVASLQKVLDAARDDVYRALRKNIMIGEAGTLPQKDILIKDLEIVIPYLSGSASAASMAMISLRDLSDIEMKYGENIGKKILGEIALICKSSFREDDIIAQVSASRIAIVLLESSLENSLVPLNRLRWKINSHEIEYEGKKLKVSAVISCTEITVGDTPAQVISRSERALIGDDTANVKVLS